jgi:hypothetical protein
MAHKGRVAPKVLKGIIFEGSFCDDPISQEYYGGVLASSKSEDFIVDRGASVISTINNLSTYQLTAHYLFYGIIWLDLDKKIKSIKDIQDPCFIENDQLIRTFNMPHSETDKDQAILDHIVYGLEEQNLIKGIDEVNRSRGLDAKWGQYHFLPTAKGIELFLWANGHGQKGISYFYSENFQPYILKELDFNDFV